jgi:hypothetical protein
MLCRGVLRCGRRRDLFLTRSSAEREDGLAGANVTVERRVAFAFQAATARHSTQKPQNSQNKPAEQTWGPASRLRFASARRAVAQSAEAAAGLSAS